VSFWSRMFNEGITAHRLGALELVPQRLHFCPRLPQPLLRLDILLPNLRLNLFQLTLQSLHLRLQTLHHFTHRCLPCLSFLHLFQSIVQLQSDGTELGGVRCVRFGKGCSVRGDEGCHFCLMRGLDLGVGVSQLSADRGQLAGVMLVGRCLIEQSGPEQL
jgi:hypothetical protein